MKNMLEKRVLVPENSIDIFNKILDVFNAIDLEKIEFDYDILKIYEEKNYDTLDECIKDVEFPENSDEIYVDEIDFKRAFKDTKYIKKLTLDLKSFDDLININFSSCIAIFYLKEDIRLNTINTIMENFNKKIAQNIDIIFGTKLLDIEKNEQKIELYIDDKRKEEAEKLLSYANTSNNKIEDKNPNLGRFTNYKNGFGIREISIDKLKEVFEMIQNKYANTRFSSYDEYFDLINQIQKSNDYKIFGLFIDDTLVTYAKVALKISLNFKKHLFIDELVTNDGFILKGYGSSMIDFLGNFALKNECKYLVTYDVYKHSNLEFYRFLQKNSFSYRDFFRFIEIE